jgi:hypothetical protein
MGSEAEGVKGYSTIRLRKYAEKGADFEAEEDEES